MEDYRTIAGRSTAEVEEKHSRFIAVAAFADSEEKALAVLEDEAGRQFDPEMAPLFVRLVREGTILVKADDDPAKEPDKDSRK